jgi:hypothetical protein
VPTKVECKCTRCETRRKGVGISVGGPTKTVVGARKRKPVLQTPPPLTVVMNQAEIHPMPFSARSPHTSSGRPDAPG